MDTVRLVMVGLVMLKSLASEAAPGANIVAARLLVWWLVLDLLGQRGAGSGLRSEEEGADEDDLDYAFPCWPVTRVLGIVGAVPVDDGFLFLLFKCCLVRLAGLLAVFRYGRLLVGGF
jgi:hypothetical protein